jgi:hypothetical protein
VVANSDQTCHYTTSRKFLFWPANYWDSAHFFFWVREQFFLGSNIFHVWNIKLGYYLEKKRDIVFFSKFDHVKKLVYGRVFFSSILWCLTVEWSQEELAKFGYRAERKVEKHLRIMFIWATCLKQLSKYDNFRWKKHSWKSSNFGAFFLTKIICLS